MVRAPSPEEEDRRRLTRERGTLIKERIQHTNRIKGLLSGQGIRDYNPLRRDRFERLEALRTGDGRELPPLLKAEMRSSGLHGKDGLAVSDPETQGARTCQNKCA